MCLRVNEMLNQVLIRDYLISNPKRAKEYELLKLKLADKYENAG